MVTTRIPFTSSQLEQLEGIGAVRLYPKEFDNLFISLRNIYPDKFTTNTPDEPIRVAQEIYKFALDKPEEFHQDLLTVGRTPDTINILKAFGADDEQIDQIFPQPSEEDVNEWLAGKLKELQGIPWEDRLVEIRRQARLAGIELPASYREAIPEERGFIEQWGRIGDIVIEAANRPLFEVAGVGVSSTDIAGLLAISIVGYQTIISLYNVAMTASLNRNIASWEKSAGGKIAWEKTPWTSQPEFVNYARQNLSAKFQTEQAIKTLFNPTKTGYILTPMGAQAVEQESKALVTSVAPSLIPLASQTFAMAQGTLPINAASWAAMSIADKVALVTSQGLEGKVASKAWADLTPAEKMAVTKVTPLVTSVTPEVTIPTTEVGMPEAGLQPSMLPEVVAKEVRPRGKGEIVQISMEEQLKLQQAREVVEKAPPVDVEAYEASAEVEGLKANLELDPVAQWRATETAIRKIKQPDGTFKVVEQKRTFGLDRFISIKEQSFPDYFTIKQAQALFPEHNFSAYTQKGTPQYNKVPRDVALDDLTKKFNMTPDEIADRVMAIRQERARIKELTGEIARLEAEKPLETLPELKPEEVAISPTGKQMLTPAQVAKTLDLFGKYIENPTTLSAWELTRELRRETLSGRAELLKARVQELIIEKGIKVEEAMSQAIKETMSGELPVMKTDYLSDLTDKMREALFDKVYQTLKDEPFEMMSTAQALTNALIGRAIPREPGVKGGSAYSRLQKVFGDQPQVLKALDKIATEKKTLENVAEGIFREIVEGGNPPIPIDQATADYLRSLVSVPLGQAYLSGDMPTLLKLTESLSAEEIAKRTLDLKIELAPEPIPVTPYEAPIESAIKQIPLLPRPARDNIIQVLKEIGMSPIDIGNFLRANKASFDFSFWRQQAPLIASHPISFVQANIEAWKALWSQKSTEASWQRIIKDPTGLYQIYEECERNGGDFLRPLELKKGTAQWRGVEEYGYITGERLIPRLTGKLPWIKLSQRAFVTGTNVHNWIIFKNYYNAMLRLNEMYASGGKTLRVGEAFDIQQEMVDFSKSLANFTARGSLGKFAATAPELSGLFFAPRAAVGRVLSVADLVNANPRVRSEAWKNAATCISVVGGIILLGAAVGWWSVEKDSRSAEYMSIRIGNTRIDPWGGYRQFLVFFTRAITGTGVSSVTGAEYEADPINLIQTFIRGKASPLASTILDFWRGKNFVGEEVDVKNKEQWVERMAPFAVWDIYEAYKEDPATAMLAGIPAVVGAGVQTYTGDWNENLLKLGLPKYEENLRYGLAEPVYDIKDWWSDTVSQFADVDPATLTEDKGFLPIVREAVEAKRELEKLEMLPSEKLTSINADPNKGTTIFQYYQMWQDRKKIVASGDEETLKEFDSDERTRRAYMGNISQRDYALLVQYHSLTREGDKIRFVRDNPSIGQKPREQYLIDNPDVNAKLATFGQKDAMTLEAYKETRKAVVDLDIPDSAIKDYLPPDSIAEEYYAYITKLAEGRANEAKAILYRNPELYEYVKGEPLPTRQAGVSEGGPSTEFFK